MKRKGHIGSAMAIFAMVACASLQPMVARAQTPARSNVEPGATLALEKMGAYLRSLKAFQVEAATSTEEVLEDGQKVTFEGTLNAVVRMPDRLRVSVNSDRRDRLYLYDGKDFTLLAQRVNYYATVPAPATIGKLAEMLDTKYGLGLPLEDLFLWGGEQSLGLTGAMFVGPSQVNGISCGQYAFRQDGLDWQVWIQMGDFPLPRKMVLTTTTDEARPQYTQTLTWNLAPSFNDAAFTFVAPKGAGRVVMPAIK
jgi:hypothetical protein